jgi:hypothetical protein
MTTELTIYDTNAHFLRTLQECSKDLPYIHFEVGYGPDVVVKASLDALWATPIAGAELFGASPPFPLHKAKIYETPAAQLMRGMPKYGVVGVATEEADPKTPEFNLRLVLSALLDAVEEFNSRHTEKLSRVGFLPDDLELKRISPKDAFRIVQEVFEQHDSS